MTNEAEERKIAAIDAAIRFYEQAEAPSFQDMVAMFQHLADHDATAILLMLDRCNRGE